MKRKLLITMAVIFIAAGSLTGGTMAAYHTATHTDKTISTSSIGVTLNIEGEDTKSNTENKNNYIAKDIENGVFKQKVSTINTGQKPHYVRVKVTPNWVENGEKIVQKNGIDLDVNDISLGLVNSEDWICIKPNEEEQQQNNDVYVYYKNIVNPNQQTSDFMESVNLFDGEMKNTNIYSGLSVQIDYEADAVQTTAAAQAMLSEWGVVAEFDENGSITAVSYK